MEQSVVNQWDEKIEKINQNISSIIPEEGLERRNWLLARGREVASKCLPNIRLDEFREVVGAMVDERGLNELPLDHKLWRDVIKQEFNQLGFEVPDEMALTYNEDVEFFMKGFSKEIRRILALALQVKN